MRRLSERIALTAVAALLIHASAKGQTLPVLAEIPSIGPVFSGTLSTQELSRGGRPFLVMVGTNSVQAWPLGSEAEPIASPGLRHLFEPAWGDFDGDGALDIAVAVPTSGVLGEGSREIAILKGDGGGAFVAGATLSVNGGAPNAATVAALAAGDFDGDGRTDLSVLSFQDSRALVLFYRGRGALEFEVPRPTDISPSAGRWLTPGDIDGDGRVDLVVSSPDLIAPGAFGTVSVWRSAGDGTFVSGAAFPGPSAYPVVLADLDGDGRTDLVYLNRLGSGAECCSYRLQVHRNQGGGSFGPWASLEVDHGRPFVADTDGDGRLDVVVPQERSSSLAVFRGGPGALTRSAIGVRSIGFEVAGADWNGDGRADFIFGTSGGLVVAGEGSSRVDVLSVPVLLSTAGPGSGGFGSDLLLTNLGSTPARVSLRYVAASGGGSGTVEREVPPAGQLHAPSAIDFLRDAGLQISREGPVVGTLRVSTSGASSPKALAATVRVTTPAGAGVSFGGVRRLETLRETSYMPWLVESERDRSNLALVNAGGADDGPVTLRITVESGNPATPGRAVLPDVVLEPGGFRQLNRVLRVAGLAARLGWARIERVEGRAPYLAWGAVNDNASDDGSFVPATSESDRAELNLWVVPVAVQSSRYATELVVTNPGEQPVRVDVTLAATGTTLRETIAPRATFHVADFFAELRRRGLAGAPAADDAIASPLYVGPYGATNGVLAGVRVTSVTLDGRSHGLFEPAVLEPHHSTSVVVPDLRQDEKTRTNLAVVNLRSQSATFRLEVFDGATGRLAASRDEITLARNELLQINAVLREMCPGVERAWARIRSGVEGSFLAFAVINDGSAPGRGTDDGSFVPGLPE
jgi:hypothetical protein